MKKKLKEILDELDDFVADAYDEHHRTRNLSKFTTQIKNKIKEIRRMKLTPSETK